MQSSSWTPGKPLQGCTVPVFPASLSHLFPSHLQELLEYMRKLEARLEKVADEKWSEDPATEDEEAAAGLSLYTSHPPRPPLAPRLMLPLPVLLPVMGKLHVPPLGAASAFSVLSFSFPSPRP